MKAQFFKTTQLLKKLFKKYLRPYKIISQPSTLLFTLCLLESMCSVHSVFHIFMFIFTTSNTFPKRKQLTPAPVIIDRELEYKILQIVDSKIDCYQVYKLLYKMIQLEYKDTEDESKQISAFKLTYAANLVLNFHITYLTKPSLLSLF